MNLDDFTRGIKSDLTPCPDLIASYFVLVKYENGGYGLTMEMSSFDLAKLLLRIAKREECSSIKTAILAAASGISGNNAKSINQPKNE